MTEVCSMLVVVCWEAEFGLCSLLWLGLPIRFHVVAEEAASVAVFGVRQKSFRIYTTSAAHVWGAFCGRRTMVLLFEGRTHLPELARVPPVGVNPWGSQPRRSRG